MSELDSIQTKLSQTSSLTDSAFLLRLVRATQPITAADLAKRMEIDKTKLASTLKPLIADGILVEETSETSAGRRAKAISFNAEDTCFIGVNLGVRHSQVGIATLRGEILDEEEFETPNDADEALEKTRGLIAKFRQEHSDRTLCVIGVSVPGMTDSNRQELIFAPNLDWRKVAIAKELQIKGVQVVVENDATAAAMYETRVKTQAAPNGSPSNFILVRSGTGIGVGLVINGEVYRGIGLGRGIAGEFGHMTIVAGGKQCVCGNRGCWEKYASAASAASLYLGDRPPARGESVPRFVEIVAKANNGDNRSRRTLEKIGDYLGIGIANVIMGSGIPRVIISGRLVYGWDMITGPLHEAINRSIVGKLKGWTIEAGEPSGAALGGALEVAIDSYLRTK